MWRNGTKGGKYERGVRIDFCRLKWVKVLSYTEKNQQFELSLFERQRGLSAVVSITNNRKRSFCSRVNHGGGGSREEKGGRERSSRLGTSRFIQKHSCAYAERKSWRKKFIGRVETRLIVLSFSPFFFPLLFSIVFFPSFLIATHHRYFVSSFLRRQPRAEETRLGEKWRARESVLFVVRDERWLLPLSWLLITNSFWKFN